MAEEGVAQDMEEVGEAQDEEGGALDMADMEEEAADTVG